MAAVAEQGYRELTQATVEAAGSKSDALEGLKSAGLGYVTFCLQAASRFAPILTSLSLPGS
jgi:hypothetical protein